MGLAACFAVRLQYWATHDLALGNHDYYMWTQYRFGTYLCGVAAGALAADWKARDKLIAENGGGAPASLALLICAVAIVGIPMTGDQVIGLSEALRERFPVAAPVWVALSRPLYGVALAVIFMLCACGCTPLVSGFLGAKAWRPVAALSYSMYLFQFASWQLVRGLWAPSGGALVEAFDAQSPRWQVGLAVWVYICAFVLADLPLSLLSHLVVERLGIELGRRLAACFGDAPASSPGAAAGGAPDPAAGDNPGAGAPGWRVPPTGAESGAWNLEDEEAAAGAPRLPAAKVGSA